VAVVIKILQMFVIIFAAVDCNRPYKQCSLQLVIQYFEAVGCTTEMKGIQGARNASQTILTRSPLGPVLTWSSLEKLTA